MADDFEIIGRADDFEVIGGADDFEVVRADSRTPTRGANRRGSRRNRETAEEAFARREAERQLAETQTQMSEGGQIGIWGTDGKFRQSDRPSRFDRDRNIEDAAGPAINLAPQAAAGVLRAGAVTAGAAADVLNRPLDEEGERFASLMRERGVTPPADPTQFSRAGADYAQALQGVVDERYPMPAARQRMQSRIADDPSFTGTVRAIMDEPVGALQEAAYQLGQFGPAARALGVVGGAALVTGGQGGAGAADDFDAEWRAGVIQKSPEFQKLAEEIGPDQAYLRLKGERIQRSVLAQGGVGAATAGLSSKLGGNFVDDLLAGKMAAGSVGKKVAGEIATESLIEEPADVLTGNVVAQSTGSDRDLTEGLGSAVAQAALTTAPIAGAFVAPEAIEGYRVRRTLTEPRADPRAAERSARLTDTTRRIVEAAPTPAAVEGVDLAAQAFDRARSARRAEVRQPLPTAGAAIAPALPAGTQLRSPGRMQQLRIGAAQPTSPAETPITPPALQPTAMQPQRPMDERRAELDQRLAQFRSQRADQDAAEEGTPPVVDFYREPDDERIRKSSSDMIEFDWGTEDPPRAQTSPTAPEFAPSGRQYGQAPDDATPDWVMAEGRNLNVRKAEAGELADAFLEIAQARDQAFQLPQVPAEARTLEDIGAAVDPAMRIERMDINDIRGKYPKAREAYRISMRDGTAARFVVEEDGGTQLNAAALEEGKSGGAALYATVNTFAQRNGLRALPDRDGLTEINKTRRTEQQAASGVRTGTAKHLVPDITQAVAGFEIGGNDRANIGALLMKGFSNTVNAMPEVHQLRYNFDSGQFEWTNGEKADDADFDRLAESDPAREAGIGRSTLKRAVLAASILRETRRRGVGSGRVLGSLGRQQLQQLAAPALERIFYSRSRGGVADAGRGTTESDRADSQGSAGRQRSRQNDGVDSSGGLAGRAGAAARPAARAGAAPPRDRTRTESSVWGELTESLGRRMARRLRAQPWLKVVNTRAEVEERWRRQLTPSEMVGGFYAPNGDVYLIADEMREQQDGQWVDVPATAIALHEIGVHYGLRGLLGGDFAIVLDQFKALAKTDARVKAAFDRVPPGTNPQDVAEEALAYYIQQNFDQPVALMDRIMAAINRFLRRFGVDRQFSPEQLLALARGAADRASRGQFREGYAARPDSAEGRERAAVEGALAFSRSKVSPDWAGFRRIAGLQAAFESVRGRTIATGRQLKLEIQNRLTEAMNRARVDLSERTPENEAYLIDMVEQDAIYAMRENANAVGWYDAKVKQALATLALVHPEIATDETSKFAFIYALAVTSNGLKVNKNFELAERAYRAWKETGQMPTDIGIGTAKSAINAHMELFNSAPAAFGSMDAFREFMTSRRTVGEIKKFARERNIDIDIGGENVGTEVYGSAIIGPKIGNGFFSNLYGRFDPLTMDRWLIRTWGRWTGTLIDYDGAAVEEKSRKLTALVAMLSDVERKAFARTTGIRLSGPAWRVADAIKDGSASADVREAMAAVGPLTPETRARLVELLGPERSNSPRMSLGSEIRKLGNSLWGAIDAQKEAPANGGERTYIRKVFSAALDRLRATYPDLTMADLQALLWYPEKRLYEAAKEDDSASDENAEEGYTDDEAPDYANAAAALARANGVAPNLIERAQREAIGAAAAVPDSTGAPRERAGAGGRGTDRPGGGEAVRKSASAERVGPRERVTRAVHDWRRRARDEGARTYSRRSGGGDSPLRGLVADAEALAVYEPTAEFTGVMNPAEVDTPPLVELRNGAAQFRAAIAATKEGNRYGASVHVYDEADYADMRLFVAPDGKAGFALKGDDIVSVFGYPNQYRSVSRPLLELAIQLGGRRLDAFNTVLPEIYADHGFRTAARLPWNDEFAPEGWDKKVFAKYNNGEPDVVFMAHDAEYFEGANVSDVEYAADYDAAVEAQKSLLQRDDRVRKSSSGASTIMVDGVARPRTDSTSKPIHPTDEGIRNFWRWFGDSKVVDSQGRPIPQFHATAADFEAFRVSSADIGAHFGNAMQAHDRGDTRNRSFMMPVYLRVENPLRVPDMGNWKIDQLQKMLRGLANEYAWPEAEWAGPGTISQVRRFLEGKGFDGLVYQNEFEAPRRPRPEDEAAVTRAEARMNAARDAVFAAGFDYYSMPKPKAGEHPALTEVRAARDALAEASATMYSNAEDTRSDSYAVFSATQVKSAIGNTGDFDPTERSILKSSSAAEQPRDDLGRFTEKPEGRAPRAKPDKRFSTSTKNEVMEEERALLAKDPVFSALPSRAHEDLVIEVRQTLKRDPGAAEQLAYELSEGMVSTVSEEQEALLLVGKIELMKKRAEVARVAFDRRYSEERRNKARYDWDQIESRVTMLDVATKTTGAIWARTGLLRQRVLREDFTFDSMAEKLARAHGRPLTANEAEELTQMAEKIRSQEIALDEARQKLDEAADLAESQRMLTDMVTRATRYLRSETKARSRSLLDVMRQMADESRAALARMDARKTGVNRPSQRKQGGAVDVARIFHLTRIGAAELVEMGYTSATWSKAKYHEWRSRMRRVLGPRKFAYSEDLMPGIARQARADLDKINATKEERIRAALDVGEGGLTHADVYELIEALVDGGMRGETEIMEEATRLLQEAQPGIALREVRRLFTDYGRARFPSNDEVKRETRKLRELQRIQESIDRLEEGLPALKTGQQRDKTDAEIRERRKRLNELLRMEELKSAADPTRLATFQDARISNLKNLIADLKRMLETGERPIAIPSPPPTDEMVKLQAEVADLRKKIREQDRTGAASSRAAKRLLEREEMLARRLADLQKRMLTGEGPAKRAPKTDKSPIENQIAALQAQLRAIERAKKPRLSRAERINRARIRALEREEELLTEELLTTLRRPANEPVPPTAEVEAKAAAVAALRQQVRDLRASMVTPEQAEQAYQLGVSKLLARQIKVVEARLASGDYSPRKRADKPMLDAANRETQFQLRRLKHAFAVKVFEAELAKRTKFQKLVDGVIEGFNITRSIMTSIDWSAILRQSLFTFGHPIKAAKIFGPMVKATFSAARNEDIEESIRRRPNYPLYEKAKLHITESHGFDPRRVEEQFTGRWLERMEEVEGQPVRNYARKAHRLATAPVRGSARAYSTFTNLMRVEMFDALHATMVNDPTAPTQAELEAVANLVNVFTGRGTFGSKVDAGGTALSLLLFAPRYLASRFNVLSLQPILRGAGASRRVAKLAAMEYARTLAGLGVIYAMAALYQATMGDEDDEDDWFASVDPRSSDFGKVKFGNVYLDPMAGLAQVTTFLSRMLTRETVAGEEEEVRSLGPDRAYGQRGAFEVMSDFARSKLSPGAGFVVNTISGEGFGGEVMTPADAAGELVMPLAWREVPNVIKERGLPEGMGLMTLSWLGMGIQYRDPDRWDQIKQDREDYAMERAR